MSNTHFGKFRGLKNSMHHALTPNYMQRMIVRAPVLKEKNLHTNAKKRWNEMTQAPLPLTYKLHELEE